MEDLNVLTNTVPVWKKKLQALARTYGMCGDNRAYLGACESKSDAIKLYKQTIDWALERDYPGLDVLRAHFGNSISEGLFVDYSFNGELLDKHQVYVFHHCTGTIKVGLNIKEKIIPMLYFANDCDMTIEGPDDASIIPIRVPIYTFGDNNILAQNTSHIEFKRYKNGRISR